MENKHTPGLPAISYPAGNYAIVTFEIPEDISKSQSHAIVRGPKHKKYAKLIASAPSLQSEIDRLTSENNDLTCKMEDLESEFNVEIDRLKEENYRLQKALDGARQSISDMKNPLKRRKF